MTTLSFQRPRTEDISQQNDEEPSPADNPVAVEPQVTPDTDSNPPDLEIVSMETSETGQVFNDC